MAQPQKGTKEDSARRTQHTPQDPAHNSVDSLKAFRVRPRNQYGVTTASSGYPGIPNSGTSRPSSSDSRATRMLFTLFTTQKTANVALKAQTAYNVAPSN